MSTRDVPCRPFITIEFRYDEIYFDTDTDEMKLEEQFRARVLKELGTRIYDNSTCHPPADLYTANVVIGTRESDSVWNYIQNIRDEILAIYKEIRKESAQ